MKNKTALQYIPRINASRLSYDDVLDSVTQHINSRSETAHNITADDLTDDDIRPQSDTVIHIFSNVAFTSAHAYVVERLLVDAMM